MSTKSKTRSIQLKAYKETGCTEWKYCCVALTNCVFFHINFVASKVGDYADHSIGCRLTKAEVDQLCQTSDYQVRITMMKGHA